MIAEYGEHLIDLLAPWGPVVVRQMFGGLGLYRQGQIFAIVVDDTLYFKVGENNRADYEAAGCEPFTYRGKNKPVTMSYWQVPEQVIDEPDVFCDWAEKAYQAKQKTRTKKQTKPRQASAAQA